MRQLVVIVGLALVVVVGFWFVYHTAVSRRRVGQAGGSPRSDGTESRTDRLHDGVDRPAGPAAETMSPTRLGGDHSHPNTPAPDVDQPDHGESNVGTLPDGDRHHRIVVARDSSHFTRTPSTVLYALLQDVEPPVTTADLVAAAARNGGGENALETLRRLPEREWERLGEAVAAAASGWRSHDRRADQ